MMDLFIKIILKTMLALSIFSNGAMTPRILVEFNSIIYSYHNGYYILVNMNTTLDFIKSYFKSWYYSKLSG